MRTALEYARRYYRLVYLETLPNMTRTQRFYERHGFKRIEKPLTNTGHFAYDVCYIKPI